MYGCTFIAKEQGSPTRDGRGLSGNEIDREMGQRCEKMVTWI